MSFDRRWLVLALVVATLFVPLGAGPFSEPDEARYAEISREMLATGDWVTPRLNGIPYFVKPPLLFWLTASSFRSSVRTTSAGLCASTR